MLRVYGDQISGWYHTHMSHNGWSSTRDWKGYKTPFRRSGHIYLNSTIPAIAYGWVDIQI